MTKTDWKTTPKTARHSLSLLTNRGRTPKNIIGKLAALIEVLIPMYNKLSWNVYMKLNKLKIHTTKKN